MRINEENYVKLLKKKKDNALSYFIDNHGWIIKSIVVRDLVNYKGVQDECINDIFISIWNNIDKYDDNKGSFLNWVSVISKYKVIDYIRKYRRELNQEDISQLDLASPEDFTNNVVCENDIVDRILGCLKKEDKELFIKIYVEGRKSSEVADEMGIKVENLYNRISKGKKKLRRNMKDGGQVYEEKGYIYKVK